MHCVCWDYLMYISEGTKITILHMFISGYLAGERIWLKSLQQPVYCLLYQVVYAWWIAVTCFNYIGLHQGSKHIYKILSHSGTDFSKHVTRCLKRGLSHTSNFTTLRNYDVCLRNLILFVMLVLITEEIAVFFYFKLIKLWKLLNRMCLEDTLFNSGHIFTVWF